MVKIPCNCGKSTPQAFIVTVPDGNGGKKDIEVSSIAQARVEITKAGGGRYRVKT